VIAVRCHNADVAPQTPIYYSKGTQTASSATEEGPAVTSAPAPVAAQSDIAPGSTPVFLVDCYLYLLVPLNVELTCELFLLSLSLLLMVLPNSSHGIASARGRRTSGARSEG
jgi:hypothetical protein